MLHPCDRVVRKVGPTPGSDVDLTRTGVTDAGLKGLTALDRLAELDLSETSVTNTGMKELTPLTGLTTLRLRKTRV